MGSTFNLGRLFGIQFRLHFSWFIIFILVTFSLVYPDYSQWLYWVMGIVASLLFFGSVVAHELAHSLVGRANGIPIESITLFIFGGVAQMTREATRPGAELKMAAAGPLCSLVIGGLFGLLLLIPEIPEPIAVMIFWLAVMNGLLAAFNLIPGFPLDGGRVFRSILWHFTGSYSRSTRIATRVGQGIGYLFILGGISIIFLQPFSLSWFDGIWIAFVGWFLNNAADASRRDVTLQEQLRGVRMREVMDASPATVSPQTSVSDVVREIFLQRGRRAAAVTRDDRVIGIVTLNDVKHLPQPKWAETPVSEIMTKEPLHTVDVDDDLNSAFRLLAQHSLNQVLVLHEGRLVGVLSRADLIRYLQLSQELGLGSK